MYYLVGSWYLSVWMCWLLLFSWLYSLWERLFGCGCLCWVGGVFGFGFGFCALVFRVCFDAALFCCLFGCDCDGWDCCFLRFLVALMWFFVGFVVYVGLLRVVV